MEVATEIRQEVLKLMQQKDEIEEEIKELTTILTKNGVGMQEPLVDSKGYPLSHVDIYQVRHARHRIICLQNDHKGIMKQIENGLHGYYSNSSIANNNCKETVEGHKESITVYKVPFAKVTLISQGSPAEYSGIEVNDLVVEFGSVNNSNFRNITDIAAVVQHSEGQKINIKLLRGDRYITSYLIPKKWPGKGLLGCNIVALNA